MSPPSGVIHRAAALCAAWLILAPHASAQVATLLAGHHAGQTILTWTEAPAVAATTPEAMTIDELRALRPTHQATSYRVYRSTAPIASVAGLEPLKTVGVRSGWNTEFYGRENANSHTGASFRYVVDRETSDTPATPLARDTALCAYNPPAAGLTYILESSPDLVTWTAVPDRTYSAGTGPLTVQDAVALSSTPRRFLRLTASP